MLAKQHYQWVQFILTEFSLVCVSYGLLFHTTCVCVSVPAAGVLFSVEFM